MQTGVFTLPFGVPFYRHVAAWLCEQNLAEIDTIWLPAPRQQQALVQALAQTATAPLLLPKMKTFSPDATAWLGVENAPDILSETARWSFFTSTLTQNDPALAMGRVVALAGAVQGVAQHLYSHSLSSADIVQLVPEQFSSHWGVYAQLIQTTLHAYEAYLAETGKTDPTVATTRWLHMQADHIKQSAAPHLALGFADTTPAGRVVLKSILQAGGAMVIPGVCAEDLQHQHAPAHPQAPLQDLLQALEVKDAAVELAPVPPIHTTCANLFGAGAIAPETLSHVALSLATSPAQEVDVIATSLHTHASAGQKSALITPDRALASAVANRLTSWGVEVDDSAGISLAHTLYGQLAQRFLQAVQNKWRPTSVVSLLTHPFLAAQVPNWAETFQVFDKKVLRGLKPIPGLGNLLAGAQRQSAEAQAAMKPLTNVLENLYHHCPTADERPVQSWWQTWQQALGVLAGTAGVFSNRPDVEHILAEAAESFGTAPQPVQGAAAYLEAALAAATVRAPRSKNTKIFIWGTLEARLQEVDFAVLGGLTRGQWQPSDHPLLSKAQWVQLGVTPPTQAGGLVAHDWAYILCQPKVLLTYSTRDSGGAPAEPARLISRLQGAMDAKDFAALSARGAKWVEHVRNQRRVGAMRTATPATGKVDSTLLPPQWSATALTALLNCPYKAYTEKLLGLKELDSWEEPAGAALRGEVLHRIFELATTPKPLPKGPQPWQGAWSNENRSAIIHHVEAIAAQVLPQMVDELSAALWAPRLVRIIPAFVDEMITRAAQGHTVNAVEQGYKRTFAPALTVYAKADRVDTTPNGAHVVDYKTGSKLPTGKDVVTGRAPQLGVLGVTAQQHHTVEDIALERYTPGGKSALETFSLKGKLQKEKTDMPNWLAMVSTQLEALATKLANPQTQLPATPGALKGSSFGGPCETCCYAGVCRVAEWAPYLEDTRAEGAQ
jgi:ATP-dependent helicase/nuclease subunit B